MQLKINNVISCKVYKQLWRDAEKISAQNGKYTRVKEFREGIQRLYYTKTGKIRAIYNLTT